MFHIFSPCVWLLRMIIIRIKRHCKSTYLKSAFKMHTQTRVVSKRKESHHISFMHINTVSHVVSLSCHQRVHQWVTFHLLILIVSPLDLQEWVFSALRGTMTTSRAGVMPGGWRNRWSRSRATTLCSMDITLPPSPALCCFDPARFLTNNLSVNVGTMDLRVVFSPLILIRAAD